MVAFGMALPLYLAQVRVYPAPLTPLQPVHMADQEHQSDGNRKAEQIKDAGIPAGRLKIFDGMSQVEHDEIVGFKIEKDLGKKPGLD